MILTFCICRYQKYIDTPHGTVELKVSKFKQDELRFPEGSVDINPARRFIKTRNPDGPGLNDCTHPGCAKWIKKMFGCEKPNLNQETGKWSCGKSERLEKPRKRRPNRRLRSGRRNQNRRNHRNYQRA